MGSLPESGVYPIPASSGSDPGGAFGGAGCIVGTMTSLTGVFVGVVLLLFGRRLYWLFVAGIGFLTGLALVPDLLPGQPEWLILLAALVPVPQADEVALAPGLLGVAKRGPAVGEEAVVQIRELASLDRELHPQRRRVESVTHGRQRFAPVIVEARPRQALGVLGLSVPGKGLVQTAE